MHIPDSPLRDLMQVFIQLMESCEPTDEKWAEILGVSTERVGKIRNFMTMLWWREMNIIIPTCTVALRDQPGAQEAIEVFWRELAELKSEYPCQEALIQHIEGFESEYR